MPQPISTRRLFISVALSDLDDSVGDLIEAVDNQLLALEATLSTALSFGDVCLRTMEAPMWAQIPAECPACGSHLDLSEPALDFSYGAHAQAFCEDCSWRGHAEYRGGRFLDLLAGDEDAVYRRRFVIKNIPDVCKVPFRRIEGRVLVVNEIVRRIDAILPLRDVESHRLLSPIFGNPFCYMKVTKQKRK